jgi:hypothetical protein
VLVEGFKLLAEAGVEQRLIALDPRLWAGKEVQLVETIEAIEEVGPEAILGASVARQIHLAGVGVDRLAEVADRVLIEVDQLLGRGWQLDAGRVQAISAALDRAVVAHTQEAE